mgnify:FL=1
MDGHGVVTSKGTAFIITRGGGRTGWKMEHSPIPKDAVPDDLNKSVSSEVKLALKAVFFLLAVQSAARR